MHFNSHRDSGRTGFLRSFVMICGWRRSESAAALRHKRRSRWSSVDRTPAAHDGQLCNSSRVISTTPVRLVSPSAVKLHFTEVSGLQDWSACELKSAVIRKIKRPSAQARRLTTQQEILGPLEARSSIEGPMQLLFGHRPSGNFVETRRTHAEKDVI